MNVFYQNETNKRISHEKLKNTKNLFTTSTL